MSLLALITFPFFSVMDSPSSRFTTLVTTHHPVLDKIGAEIIKITTRTNLDCLKTTKLVHAKRQPPNLKRILTRTNTFKRPEKGVKICNKPRCGLCIHGHNNLLEGESITLKNGKVIKANKLITCESTNLVYCVICPRCREFYIGECKTLRARMNLHRNHSNPGNIMAPPLKVNQHLKSCADGYFLVYPFHVVNTNHQITREAYEKHFQKILHPTLHLKAQEKKKVPQVNSRLKAKNLHVQTQAQSWSPANEISARADSHKYLKTRNNQKRQNHMKSFRFKITLQLCIFHFNTLHNNYQTFSTSLLFPENSLLLTYCWAPRASLVARRNQATHIPLILDLIQRS